MVTEGLPFASQVVSGVTVDRDIYQIQAGGDVSVGRGPSVRSAYFRLVRQIAPESLRDREHELDVIKDFCLGTSPPSYLRWRAEAWAGKSALMSWFALHPPPGVDVVSFFVTARFANQSNRESFIDIVLEQLLDLLAKPMPALLTPATREAHLGDLLDEAAAWSGVNGRRLVLLVDGLDEDRGVTVGPDAYSIAALLPAVPPHDMRVLVSGRPKPPIPSDVADDHPLRDPDIARELAPSAYAKAVRADARRELARLLHGTEQERHVLGLVAAAGDGLTVPDLSELTGYPAYDVEQIFESVAGRTFVSRPSRWQPEIRPESHVLGHEELQDAAIRVLHGRPLDARREQINEWAGHYAGRGWPPATPDYLIQGYFRMLRDAGEHDRLLALAQDATRHDCMLEITGGDTAALAEIALAQDLTMSTSDPDLLVVARLAMRRSRITDRSVNIPVRLPALWATLGERTRAEALALGIPDPERQLVALCELMKTGVGQPDDAASLSTAGRAERLAEAMASPAAKVEALAMLTAASRRAGNGELARRLAQRAESVAADAPEAASPALIAAVGVAGDLRRAEEMISDLGGQQRLNGDQVLMPALVALIEALLVAGAPVEAGYLAPMISIRSVRLMPFVLTVKSRQQIARGDSERAAGLARRAVEMMPFAFRRGRTEDMLMLLGALSALSASGDPEGASDLALELESGLNHLPDQDLSPVTMAVADVHAAGGYESRLSAWAARTTDSGLRAELLVRSAQAAQRGGRTDRAVELAGAAELAVRDTSDPIRAGQALKAMTIGLAAAGRYRKAEDIARLIEVPALRHQALAAVAVRLAGAGFLAEAERVARDIEDVRTYGETVLVAVTAAARTGQAVEARRLADGIDDRKSRMRALVVLAVFLPTHRESVPAESIAQHIYDPLERLTALAPALEHEIGDDGPAQRVARDSIAELTDPADRVRGFGLLAEGLGAEPQSDGEPALRVIREAMVELAGIEESQGHDDAALGLARSLIRLLRTARHEASLELGLLDSFREVLRVVRGPGRSPASALWAAALAVAGRYDEAEEAAGSAAEPTDQSRAFGAIAREAGGRRGCIMAAKSLRTGEWISGLVALGAADPDTLEKIFEEMIHPNPEGEPQS